MPTFDAPFATPEPISATAQVDAGSIRFIATDRVDTVVDVQPRDPKRNQDVRVAEQTEVRYASGLLTIRTPKQRYIIGRTGSVDVTVELPTGSRVDMTGAWAQVYGEGRLGEVRVKTSSGDVRFDTTGPLHVAASHGSITVDRVEGPAEMATSSGSMRIGTIEGAAVLKNSHGSTTVGDAMGELRVNGSNGDISIERARTSVTAATANGAVRVGDVSCGTVKLETSHGAIEIGIREGTAAWVDAGSGFGKVHNALGASDSPDKTEDTVEVRARTSYGNIDIRRARA
ncbi:DUF4097 domain-containing protein [Streptomyces sp. NBC_00440]|uniref:DUF4097 family beta strand repeat-containing protein n=1 Tax=unclassified Streptomyces TaxID=2593676 RepID=UPI002E23EE4D|nr:DUF4097 domain-containing protein [Streptomyces sp. NBC_00932]